MKENKVIEESIDVTTGRLVTSDEPFVPKEVKTKRVERSVKKAESKVKRYGKFKLDLDFWLRHELGLGTIQIRKLWTKMNDIVLK